MASSLSAVNPVYPLRYTQSGHIFIDPQDDPHGIVDAMLCTNYSEEFCIALDFDAPFVADLMAAGFLVMSTKIGPDPGDQDGEAAPPDSPPSNPTQYLLLPKLHLERSVLFFPDLHVTKTAKRLLKRYELRFDPDFNGILERCVRVHGDAWLTPPLRKTLREIRDITGSSPGIPAPRPVSFGVYREGELKAGEFGVICGGVYTSYSGYQDEDSAGTVQMVLTARWLMDRGFAFLDLGMPLEYKDRLGAHNVDPRSFVELFRGAGI
jgi:Leu/Phe-tRNA-protein transferase